jgi:hypothetical protein
MRTHKRIHDHINGPCRDDTGKPHVFLTHERIAQIKWEECVVRSQAKRENRDIVIEHHDCCCGSLSCLRVPIGRKVKLCWCKVVRVVV